MPSRRWDRQLIFDLSRQPCFDREDFLVSRANEAAAVTVRSWPAWSDRTLLLIGPPGSGKSHLASIWAADCDAIVVPRNGPLEASTWDGGGRRVLLEDCDRTSFTETQLFHALNLVRETEGWLLMTTRTPPASWGVSTPDLVSRLRLAATVTVEAPDGELIKAVLVKLFADRQILIDEDVVSYAARHSEQSFEAVSRFVEAVDAAALTAGRRITRPLAAATLNSLQADSPD